jgi:hypothetical protein
MFDRAHLRLGLRLAGLISLSLAAWYAWTRVDWYDYSAAVPPDSPGETVDDPHAELLSVTIDGEEPSDAGAKVTAGILFSVESRLRLDPDHWVYPMSQGNALRMRPSELARLREKQSTRSECAVHVEIVRKSWLAAGEKRVLRFSGTTERDGRETIRCTADVPLFRPGVYLVRVRIGEQKPLTTMAARLPPILNERTLKTFLLHVVMPEPAMEKSEPK